MTHLDRIREMRKEVELSPRAIGLVNDALKTAEKEGYDEGYGEGFYATQDDCDAKLTHYESVVEAARQIFDVVKFPRDKTCPHGNAAVYPGHAWYCDDCWQQLESALAALEAQGGVTGDTEVDFAPIRKLLGSPDILTRDNAGLALADIDDPIAIPWLKEAISRESSETLRRNFQLVIDQLVATKKVTQREVNDGMD